METKFYFSDFFGIEKLILEDYGAFDISLIADLPLFIDPFLLFNSSDSQYRKLHVGIIRYLLFLKQKTEREGTPKDAEINRLYRFKEVKENWLGFSKIGNNGRGLGKKFAHSLNDSFSGILKNFGEKGILKSDHFEKFSLIDRGIGRDMMSDFCTNLTKEYLLKFTEKFSNIYLKKSQIKKYTVEKVRFNYDTESWEHEEYTLPVGPNGYVLLTPKNILTRDEAWINRRDLQDQISMLPNALPDDQIRSAVENYFRSVLPKKAKKGEIDEAWFKTLKKFPELYDVYIKTKEDAGERAPGISSVKVKKTYEVLVENVRKFFELLDEKDLQRLEREDSLSEALARIGYYKDKIEKNDGYKIFYDGKKRVKSEKDVQLLFRFVWYGSTFSVDAEVDNGRGSADYKISKGSKDSTIIEFKLAASTHLERNLEKQLEIYKESNSTLKGVFVIVYFSDEDYSKAVKVLKKLKIFESKNVVLIDAKRKKSASVSHK